MGFTRQLAVLDGDKARLFERFSTVVLPDRLFMRLRISTLRLSLSPAEHRGGDTVKDGGWGRAPILKVFSNQLMY